ncbi:MAG: hypothetical protein IKR11_11785 [Solobacterium sp.]|nr:hypothetical protein [Solobacterium sp.]
MANLSRKERYKELRESLQNDTGAEINSKELSRFSNRLNQIDADNFSALDDYAEDDHVANHARNTYYEEPVKEEEDEEPVFDTSIFGKNENNYTSSFENDYLDQYIREVKQYNIDQGNALSDNTQVNVLRQLNNANRKRQQQPAPSKPYPTEPSQPRPQQQAPRVNRNTTDIPFTSPRRQPSYDDYQEFTNDNLSRTREHIAAEVQNLVNNTNSYSAPAPEPEEDDFVGSDTFNRQLEADRKERQKLLTETTQIRAQMDDYEDNMNEVSDKVRHTSRILNTVLVILIIALMIMLAIVLYLIVIVRT